MTERSRKQEKKPNESRAGKRVERIDAPRSKQQREAGELDAASAEEVDALRVNLMQEDEHGSSRDSSGHVVDELAEERMAKFTEVGPLSGERGAESLTPGRNDTSKMLRSHRPITSNARAQDMVESDLDPPGEDTGKDRKEGEDTAA